MSVYDERPRTLEVTTDEFPALGNAQDGQRGTGKFNFVVQGGEHAGRATILVEELSLDTENTADKALKDMVGDTANPPKDHDEEDEDDRTDVV